MKRLSSVLLSLALALSFAGIADANEAFRGPLGVLGKTAEATDGYVLISPQASKTTYLIDNDGNVVREWKSEYPSFYAELLPNGNLARHSRNPAWGPNFGGAGGIIEEFDWNGNIVFSYTMYEENKEILHHTFSVMPNGNYLLLGWEYKPYEEALAKGLNVDAPGRMIFKDGMKMGNMQVMGVWPDFIREVDHSGKTVWEWHVWDHVGTGADKWDINAFCPVVYGFRPLAGPDWTHFNGLSYNPKTDEIAITSRNLAEVYVINKTSGKLTYRWGNPANYGAGKKPGGYGDNGDQQLFGPHAPRWTEEGNITILDNGTARPTGTYTRAVELDPRTSKVVWEWAPGKAGVNASNFYSPFQCGVQKIGNGNYLITTSNDGHVIEVKENLEVVWEFLNPVDADKIHKATNALGKGGDGIHRAMRYPKNFSGFQGKEMKTLYQMPNWVNVLQDGARPNPEPKK